jgi:hypothetical protein
VSTRADLLLRLARVRFPQHREQQPTGRCADCNIEAVLVGAWGEKQEQKLCSPCDEVAWLALLKETGRLRDWLRMIGQ